MLRFGHFFSDNPLVEGYAGYPTISGLTAALSSLGHLSIFNAAIVVAIVARGSLMLVLFLFLERITGSARSAGIGMAIYACNPNFLYFDSQFAYESLALPIAATLLLVTCLWEQGVSAIRARVSFQFVIAMAILVCTLTVTHHMTSYAMLAFFLLWAALDLLSRWPLLHIPSPPRPVNAPPQPDDRSLPAPRYRLRCSPSPWSSGSPLRRAP